MSHKTRKVKYIECDGCGYEINQSERYTTLDLQYKIETTSGKILFHFHPVSTKHDCLRYWLTGTGILERSMREVNELASDSHVQFIVENISCAARKKVPA